MNASPLKNIMAHASSSKKGLPSLVTDAMKAIATKFEPLRGMLLRLMSGEVAV